MRLVLTALFSVLATCVGVMAVEPSVRLAIAYDRQTAIPASIRLAATREAMTIWSHYGIDIVEQGESAGPAGTVLAVFLDISHGKADGEDSLGTIRFSADGVPDSAITLYYRVVERLATQADAIGIDSRVWPARLSEALIARTLGRALAHEIGHYVLRSPHHSESGLMRARQRASILAEPSGRPFLLADGDRQRLEVVRTALWSQPVDQAVSKVAIRTPTLR